MNGVSKFEGMSETECYLVLIKGSVEFQLWKVRPTTDLKNRPQLFLRNFDFSISAFWTVMNLATDHKSKRNIYHERVGNTKPFPPAA